MDCYTPELGRFYGDSNPEVWVFQAERYFNFYGFAKDSWLSMPYVYFKGEARAWFDGLYRNNQFYDWNHFTKKLALHYHNRTFADPIGYGFSYSHVVSARPTYFSQPTAFMSASETRMEVEDTTKNHSVKTEAQVFDKRSHTFSADKYDLEEANDGATVAETPHSCCSKVFDSRNSDMEFLPFEMESALEDTKSAHANDLKLEHELVAYESGEVKVLDKSPKRDMYTELSQIEIADSSIVEMEQNLEATNDGSPVDNSVAPATAIVDRVPKVDGLEDISIVSIPTTIEREVKFLDSTVLDAMSRSECFAVFLALSRIILRLQQAIGFHNCHWVDTGQEQHVPIFLLGLLVELANSEHLVDSLPIENLGLEQPARHVNANLFSRCSTTWETALETFEGRLLAENFMEPDTVDTIVIAQCVLSHFSFDSGASTFLVSPGGLTLLTCIWDPGISMSIVHRFHVFAAYKTYSFLANEVNFGGVFLKKIKGDSFGGPCFQKHIPNLAYFCKCRDLREVVECWELVNKLNDYLKTNSKTWAVLQKFPQDKKASMKSEQNAIVWDPGSGTFVLFSSSIDQGINEVKNIFRNTGVDREDFFNRLVTYGMLISYFMKLEQYDKAHSALTEMSNKGLVTFEKYLHFDQFFLGLDTRMNYRVVPSGVLMVKQTIDHGGTYNAFVDTFAYSSRFGIGVSWRAEGVLVCLMVVCRWLDTGQKEIAYMPCLLSSSSYDQTMSITFPFDPGSSVFLPHFLALQKNLAFWNVSSRLKYDQLMPSTIQNSFIAPLEVWLKNLMDLSKWIDNVLRLEANMLQVVSNEVNSGGILLLVEVLTLLWTCWTVGWNSKKLNDSSSVHSTRVFAKKNAYLLQHAFMQELWKVQVGYATVVIRCLLGVDIVKRILLQFSLSSNLEDKVLIEGGGIVMNYSWAYPGTQTTIGPGRSNWAGRYSHRLLDYNWDPG